MATATFQGMSYPAGSTYGRDIAFFPAVPADVEVKVDLYPFLRRERGTVPLLCRARLVRGHIRRARRDEAFYPRCAG